MALHVRPAVAVTGGTFEGPRLRGRVLSPGAAWPMTMGDGLRILDVRTVLLNRIIAVGVSYTVPQRVSYRIFQIL